LICIKFAKSREEIMGELKSAFERAMEKAGKLGSLSSEEMKKQEEQRLSTVGRAIADKYLNHGHAQVLKDDIEKFRADEKDVVSRGARLGLAESISFDKGVTAEALDRVAAGLLTLATGNKGVIEELISKVRGLLEELEVELDRTYSNEFGRIESDKRGLLHELGISGSAIAGINVEGSSAWEQIENDLRLQYNAKLELLRRELSQAVV
jgi:hypothetical protein